jgi:photosystem II stability/assembly factor-like uncharacterized protein
MDDGVTLLVGTTKGLFLIRGDARRADWAVAGPFCDGWPIHHAVGDPADGAIWAAGGGEFPGAGVWRSTDGGAKWSLAKFANGKIEDFLRAEPEMAAVFGRPADPPAPFDGALDSVWSLALAGDTLWAGARPAALYRSRDRGASWERATGLDEHPSRADWRPGGAGLTLHAIVADPDDPRRLWVGVSAAGVFASEDGGESWERRLQRSNADAAHAPHHPGHDAHEVGSCVHALARAPGAGVDRLYQQNHHGVFASLDGGRSWREITAGLPSGFGFPVAAHPRDPLTLWVLPLNGDTAGRYPPDAAAAVWRSRDGGESWTAGREGLPQRHCFFTVLRRAMATDRGTPAGVYFGTNSGSVFASADEGDSWREIARHLPTVLSVATLERA